MDFNIILTTAVLLHTLQLPSMSKGQALQWQINKSSEIIFGRSEMELICSGSACCTGSLRRWTAGPSSTVLMSNGAPSDSTKYEEILATNSFSLKFKSLELADFNLQYKCSIDFASSTQNVLLPTTDVFRYVPDVNNEIKIEKNLTGGNITLTANLTRVFPEPTCTATLEDSNITDRLVLTTYENTPVNFTIIEMNNIPYQCSNGRRNLFISCYVGSIQFTVIQEELCKVSKEVDDKTYDFIQYNGFVNLGGSGVSGGGCAQVLIHGTLTITAKKAGLLFFSNQYFIGGTVVYGIQIVFVSTAINTITIISGVVLLAIYFGKVQCIAIPYFILMAAAASMLSVLIFMAIVYLFGHKEFIHIKFKNRKKSKNMSSLGLKLTKNDTINFSFKVKAINACMTLHVLENGETESISKSRKVKMVLGDGFPENRVPNSRDSLICNIVSDTEYTSFCLNTKNKHITLLNEQGGIILQWTCSAESFTVKDIEISNINQDDSTKDSSTEKEKEEKLDTPDEWIFWFRKGDTLCEFGEHEREIKEGLRCKQTVQLICVVIFPIAWLVMIVLMVKYLFKSKGKKADDNESEMSEQLNQKQKESSEQQNKKQKDTKGKWFDFIWFSCFHNSVKPNLTTDDNKPKAMMPGSYLANLPKGRKLPQLGEIVTQGNETRKPKKKDKKKKKIKNQDSNMNDKQQSHSDKQNITFQPEIAVAADKLEAE